MDASRTPTSLYYRTRGVTPNKSPTAENVQRRRRDIERSEKAAYWALFNTSVALLLYYDLCYIQVLEEFSILLIYFEWLICTLFTTSALYDFLVHFWPHTFMKPIVVTPHDKRLLGIQEDELGFKVEEPAPVKFEPVHDNLPPYEIHYSFEEEEKVVTPSKKQNQSMDTSINTSRRSKVVDKESLIEYLKNCQILEDRCMDNSCDLKQNYI